MKGLAELIVRGRWQAVLVTAAAGMLTYLLPPFSTLLAYLAAAAVALVTLHVGVLPGLQVLVLSSAVTLLFYQLLVLLLWTPCWLLALVLRQTRSLGHTLLAGVLFGGSLRRWLPPNSRLSIPGATAKASQMPKSTTGTSNRASQPSGRR